MLLLLPQDCLSLSRIVTAVVDRREEGICFSFCLILLTFGRFSCYNFSYKFWIFYWSFFVFERRNHYLIIQKGERVCLCWIFNTICVSSRENFFHDVTKKTKKLGLKKNSSSLIRSKLHLWGTNTNSFSAYLCTCMDSGPPRTHEKRSETSLRKHLSKKKKRSAYVRHEPLLFWKREVSALTLIVKCAGAADLHSELSGEVWMALEQRQVGGSFSQAENLSSLQSFLSLSFWLLSFHVSP